MKQAELVRMANQIADFFKAYPQEQAIDSVAQHVVDFWDPRMKADIGPIVAQDNSGLSDLARAGLEKTLS